jgi:hypothetical protein
MSGLLGRPAPKRFGNRVMDGPSSQDARAEHPLRQAEFLGPRRHALRFAIKGQQAIPARIARLSFAGKPADVARLIVSVCIDAVQRAAGRTRTDVGKKRREIVSPVVGHPNTAATVHRVAHGRRVVAAANGVAPRAIFSREFSARRMAVGATTSSYQLSLEASATARVAAPKIVAVNRECLSAVASAKPISAARWGALDAVECDQPIEPLAGYIDPSSHASFYHDNAPTDAMSGAEMMTIPKPQHHVTDVAAGFALGWSTTLVWQ